MIPRVLAWIQNVEKLASLAQVMRRITLNLLGALIVGAALNLQLPSAFAQGTGYTLLTTITNPTPADFDHFGICVAALGPDQVLIGAHYGDTGAEDAGAVYLFSTKGELLTTFTNPTPAFGDFFGSSVAALGNDRVLIGAYADDAGAKDSGAAYLLSTNGTLLTTFTNPTPASEDFFGISVAAVGTDRVLIGANRDNTGTGYAGTAYLFSTNGELLTTFANPTPATGDEFGISVAAVGGDRVLIGADGDNTGASGAGTAYLFSNNGELLTTFTNPTPAFGDWFGCSVAAVGTDKVLIGAMNGGSTGAAYLFSTNGVLLTTITNPIGEAIQFGCSVAAVGRDRVLIGAYLDSRVVRNAGAAYLFNTDGVLLTTLTNPAPAVGDYFGISVADVGNGQVLIGAFWDDRGANNPGAAYLFSISEQSTMTPSLTIRTTPTNTVAVSWPSPTTGWTLQQNTNGVESANWSNAPGPIQDDGTTKTLLVTPSAENRFYRLFKP